MASKRRLRRKACEGKIRHEDKVTADRHAAWARWRSKSHIAAYQCPHCGGFHIGHPSRRNAIKRRAMA